jgi:hypothetical protein
MLSFESGTHLMYDSDRHRRCERMLVGFTTTYAISVYNH